ncbi:serpin family protein [Bacillus tuaregi]|uniref:serpin family protein n=1 Tax=Bacillus tuaregi TaxID=1816695 RepID=UPI0008F8A2F8|nr:serpin family protein [Bacillus tuaregi]
MVKKMVLGFIFIFMIVAAGCSSKNQVVFSKDDYKKIAPANNQLGFTLLSEIEKDEAGNTFISPTSLFMALSMIYNGTNGETREELAKLLQAEGISDDELNQANASLMSILQKDSKSMEVNIANSIWLNERFHFQEDFSNATFDYYHAATEAMDLTDSRSADKINKWVKEKTKGTIEKMVQKPLKSDLVAILINAIYFKGNWKNEFDPKLTEERPFYLEDGTVKDWPLMTISENMAYTENDSFQAVSLPYGEGEMSMKIFLPKAGSSLAEFESMLSSANWGKWNQEFHHQEGTIWLPKFQLEYEVSLNESLKTLGMTTAFDKGANFTKMIQEDNPVWISQVKQKTFIDVNEEGTEASAATSVEMKTTSAPADGPFYMEINRPFFFVITDDSNTILFMGAMKNPQMESK